MRLLWFDEFHPKILSSIGIKKKPKLFHFVFFMPNTHRNTISRYSNQCHTTWYRTLRIFIFAKAYYNKTYSISLVEPFHFHSPRLPFPLIIIEWDWSVAKRRPLWRKNETPDDFPLNDFSIYLCSFDGCCRFFIPYKYICFFFSCNVLLYPQICILYSTVILYSYFMIFFLHIQRNNTQIVFDQINVNVEIYYCLRLVRMVPKRPGLALQSTFFFFFFFGERVYIRNIKKNVFFF